MASSEKKKDAARQWAHVDGGSAFIIPYTLLRHPNFVRLTPVACKLLLDLGRQYSGFNNGYLSAAFAILHSMGWKSETTVREALAELIHYKLIVMTRQGGRNKCSLFAVTWWQIHAKPHKPLDYRATERPSNDWKCELAAYEKPSRRRKVIPRGGCKFQPPRS